MHVIGGLATIPLLFAKLWTVYPKLWQWPPFRSVPHAVERALVLLLVGGALFQLVTGPLNVSYAYLSPMTMSRSHRGQVPHRDDGIHRWRRSELLSPG
ncbi:hypothetical protein Psi02_70810 [Planotetraspora silvatica]|uniref:Uncharacterized protein n=1 Tax=Planotetraspora silvatica TaxID=234614 RepID=A0A8J3USS2_9ACTN|nr:hypothetical protein Psi02_70810 [Planotetraspora silvatica]